MLFNCISLLCRMEAQQRGVDHNIMRHINQSVPMGDDEDQDYDDDGMDDELKDFKDQRPALALKKAVPNYEVKKNMRVALFGFLEASQNDEDELVSSN